MKLGALKQAIRDLPGAPKISFNAGGICPLNVPALKGGLLEALDEAFPQGRSVETGLKLVELPTGSFLTREAEEA
jgi:hypothetical protein